MAKKTVALVTGANRGIGFETARQLATLGMTVLLGARDAQRGADAASKLRNEGLDVESVVLDVNDLGTHESIANLIESRHGKLDVLIQNAGILIDEIKDGSFLAASITNLVTIRKTFETNFFNVISLTQILLPFVKKSEAGRIVFVSSLAGSLALLSDPAKSSNRKPVGYDMSKSALNSFAIHLANELRDTPIKVNVAHPGSVVTEMNKTGRISVSEGAKTSVQLATLPADGFTGKFIFLGEEYPW